MQHKINHNMQIRYRYRQLFSGLPPVAFFQSRYLLLLGIVTSVFWASCQSDNKKAVDPAAESTAVPASESPAPAAFQGPLLLAITDGKAVMSDSTFISIPHFTNPEYTIFYCVRHAEKRKDQGDNPDLSTEGEARAKRLGVILSGDRLERVFSTNYKRTVQTAEAVRRSFEKPPAGSAYPPSLQDAWIDETLGANPGKHFLVVGHQNTIPQLLNRLKGVSTYQNLGEDEYDRFYIVVAKSIGVAEVLELHY